MYDIIFNYLGKDNLENLAVSLHIPQKGTYIYVNEDGTYKAVNEKRAAFNSRYCGMDYYSRLVSMNKPISSKSISSNNYLAFFCKKALPDKDIDNYYNALEVPENKKWIPAWIKTNLPDICKKHKGLVRIFFPGSREEYRKLGLENWLEKSVSFTKFSKEKGAPLGFNINPKKSYLMSEFNTYLVDPEEGLWIKLFHDILTGIAKRGKDIVYFYPGGIYATNGKEGPPNFCMDSPVICQIGFNKTGSIEMRNLEHIPSYSPFLSGGKRRKYIGTIKLS